MLFKGTLIHIYEQRKGFLYWDARRVKAEQLVFVTGGGGAGLHSPRPALTRRLGGIFWVIPTAPLLGAHADLFPGQGPVRYHPFLTGTRPGYGWGGGLSGDRGREC